MLSRSEVMVIAVLMTTTPRVSTCPAVMVLTTTPSVLTCPVVVVLTTTTPRVLTELLLFLALSRPAVVVLTLATTWRDVVCLLLISTRTI